MTAKSPQAHGCTVVVRNRLPFARVLAAGFRAHHPGGDFTALLLDDHDRAVDDGALPFNVVRLDALDLTQEDIHRRALAYSVAGLADSVKPVLLSRLLADHEVVMYLDPDIAVYAGLDRVAGLAAERGLVLTPQTLAPVPWDGLRPSEADVLAAGAFSLDFLAVSRAAKSFLQWWSERASTGLYRDPEHAGARSWTGLVPGYFSHALLDDPGSNVGYWNLDQRTLRHGDSGYEVDGAALRFFHFRGYDPRTPWLLTAGQTQPRVLLSANPALQRLCDGYRRELLAHGWVDADAWEYGFGRLPDGTVVDEVVRGAYRRALMARGATSGPPKLGTGPVSGPPPDPFDAGAAADFMGWLAGPDDDWPRSPVSRYLSSLWRLRPELQHAFPDPHGGDARQFVEWAAKTSDAGLSAPFVDTSVTQSRRRLRLRGRRTPALPGANVVGYPRGEFGLGESTRQTMAALGAADIPFHLTGLPAPVQRHGDDTYPLLVADGTPAQGAARSQADRMPDADLPYDVTLLCANADVTPAALAWLGAAQARGRRTVGMWYWELERFPPSLHPALDLVDEVWVASEFVRASVGAETSKPVRLVLPALQPPKTDPALTRSDVGLPPDAFLFMFVFDFYSVAARKNPLGLVEAYRSAFGAGDGTGLVLKTINADMNPADAERLRLAIADRPDVILLEQTMRTVEKNSLIGLCDAYVSLHRSEGFGLTMAEAMALGKPVIATAYSGNRMFMRADNSYLVPYTMTEVPPGAEPYPPGYLWAEPDLTAAADLMRYVRANQAAAARVAERGRAAVLAEFSLPAAARTIRAAWTQVRAARPV